MSAIEVEPLVEVYDIGDMGQQFGYFAKGHHDPAVFLEAVDYYGAANDCPGWLAHYRPMVPEDVRHEHWRCIPLGEGFYRYETSKPGRGAFPVTVIEWKRRLPDSTPAEGGGS